MTSSPDRRAVVLAGLVSAVVAPQALAVPSAVCAAAGITEPQFRSYIDAFNRGDHHGYTDFYTPDVTLNVVGKMFLRGANEVVAFYSQVRTTARRTIVVDRFDAGRDVIAVMLRSMPVRSKRYCGGILGGVRKQENRGGEHDVRPAHCEVHSGDLEKGVLAGQPLNQGARV